MRVPPPGLLKLDKDALLRDVAARLSSAGPPNPSDPAWLLLEQAAWMVEVLSGQLDQYPFAVLRQLLHVLGGQLHPALPSLGVVVASVSREGVLRVDPRRPSPWRLFTPQRERRDAVEFAPAEPELPLWRGGFVAMHAIVDGELFRVGVPAEDGVGALSVWAAEPARSAAFDGEQIRYNCVTSNAAALMEQLRVAIAATEERRVGWLRFHAEQTGPDRVTVSADIDPGGAFRRAAPGGIWGGGDLEGDWGGLDESTWTPPVTVADLSILPPRLRGTRPLPGAEEGRILVPEVPADVDVSRLLVRRASPTPAGVVEAIWRTLASGDTRLLALRPGVQRAFRSPGAPSWLAGALERGLWQGLAEAPSRVVAQLRLTTREPMRAARVAVVFADKPAPVAVYALDASGAPQGGPLPARVAWTLPAPREGRGLATVVALDLPTPSEPVDLLVSTAGRAEAVLANAMLVINAPAVRDGRRWTVNRHVPERLSLLFEDIVGPEVLRNLLATPLGDALSSLLDRLPLARFSLDNGEVLEDFAGLTVDAAAGEITLNAPDAEGTLRAMRPGSRLRLDWYRRTDGAAGDVPAGAISLVEQEPELRPFLLKVHNPLPTSGGADRESPEAAIDRMSVGSSGLPALPSEFERLLRQALGSRGQGWIVRVWSYAERALLSVGLWPLGDEDPETRRLRRALETAGPEVLLVLVGERDRALSEADLAWATLIIQHQVRQLGQRLPVVREAIVSRLWPLTLRPAGRSPANLPAFAPADWSGTLEDCAGRQGVIPLSELVLNAAVTAIDVEQP